ncbi:uncharacterized protein LOC129235150 [Uloborus diversus]|uniref:uncharacterized protein LOC129235150 n=1 Tax=Uloborus diversus TaxID=327109 RepID=UPI002409F059|nr:uncharacterized protein LOC129235150 [Uloborus diversus]
MSNFKHSIVLFSGDDGLPLEFNIINTTEKELLKALIEHGGGLCTLSDDAVHLVSPGTRVFNVDFSKKFLSSKFVLDCAEKNYLMNMSDYEIKITALETSDISDDSGNIIKPSNNIKCVPVAGKNVNTIEIDTEDESPQNSKSKIVCSNVCSDDFVPSKLGMFSSTPSAPIQENSPKKVVEMDLITEEPSLEQVIEQYTSASEIANDTKREVTDMDIDIDIASSPNNLIEEYNSISKLGCVDKIQALTKEAHINNCNLGEGEISDRTPSDLQVQVQVDESESHIAKENVGEKDDHLGENEISDRTPSDLQVEGMQIDESESHISKKNCSRKNESLGEGKIPGSPDKQVEGGNCEHFLKEPRSDQQNTKILPDELEMVEKDVFQVNTPEKKCPEPEISVIAVSSSQPQDEIDDFDCMIFKKSQKAQVNEEDECLSQSYTVSSSADAQVSSKGDVSGEIFENNFPAESDCDKQESRLTERQLYIQKLEKEVEKVLQKPSPKSIQDKLILVKYVCCVKRLSPAEVIQSLPNI